MPDHPLQLLLLQILVILAAARLVGKLFRLAGLPQVIGEMAAGILLGPTALGHLANGQVLHWLFPTAGAKFLDVLAQVGVMFFMFLVGLELDLKTLAKQGKTVLAAGIASIAAPFLLGVLLAILLILLQLGSPSGSTLAYLLFIGTAISTTAFPVLARILTESNLQRSKVGKVAIGCAAVNDIAGWCLLALTIAIARATGEVPPGSSTAHELLLGGATALFAALYLAGMIWLVRPILRHLQAIFESRGYLSADILATIFMLLAASSYLTDVIGVHAIFGAFMLGAVMPSEEQFVEHLAHKIEDFAILFLLPLFFAFTGLHTDLGLLADSRLWGLAALVTALATLGKVGGTYWAARRELSRRESLVLGVLMNTRGLMELIILNVGLDLHVVSPTVFALMVVMTLLTTLATAPLVRLLYSPERRFEELVPRADIAAAPQVVVAVSRPATVAGLVRVGAMLLGSKNGRLWGVHIERAEDQEHQADRPDALALAQEAAASVAATMHTVQLVSDRFDEEITAVARQRRAEWIVVGWHKPILDHSLVGGTVKGVLRRTPCNVAVVVDKGLGPIRRVLVPFMGDPQDAGALLAAERLAEHPDVEVTILHLVSDERARTAPLGVADEMDRCFTSPLGKQRVHMRVLQTAKPLDLIIEESHRYDLACLGVAPNWQTSDNWLTPKQETLTQLGNCSFLIAHATLKPTPSHASQPALTK